MEAINDNINAKYFVVCYILQFEMYIQGVLDLQNRCVPGPCIVNFVHCKDDYSHYRNKLYIHYVKGWEFLEMKQMITCIE